MTIELTEQQQQVFDKERDLRIVDPRTNNRFVLVPERDFETIRELIEDERQQSAIRKVGRRNAIGRMEEP